MMMMMMTMMMMMMMMIKIDTSILMVVMMMIKTAIMMVIIMMVIVVTLGVNTLLVLNTVVFTVLNTYIRSLAGWGAFFHPARQSGSRWKSLGLELL